MCWMEISLQSRKLEGFCQCAMSGYLQVSLADGDNHANVILIMILHIFNGCQYFQWMSLFSVDLIIFSSCQCCDERRNLAGDENCAAWESTGWLHLKMFHSLQKNLSWLSIYSNAGIVATVSTEPGCGWIATRAVAASSVVQSHHHRHHHLEHQQHLEHQWHRHQQPLEHDCNYATCPITLVHGIKSSSSCHLHLSQANGGGALLHVTNRFQCLCGFFAFLSVCLFYSHHHGRFPLAYCANCVFLLFLGAKIMASPRT